MAQAGVSHCNCRMHTMHIKMAVLWTWHLQIILLSIMRRMSMMFLDHLLTHAVEGGSYEQEEKEDC